MAKSGHTTEPALAAQMLLEAVIGGDKVVAAKYGVSTRTIQRIRKRAETGSDTKLSEEVAKKKQLAEREWSKRVPEAMGAAVNFLETAARQADPKDPGAIHSIAGALKMLSEVAATWKVLDARLSQNAGQNREGNRQIPASGDNVRPLKRAG